MPVFNTLVEINDWLRDLKRLIRGANLAYLIAPGLVSRPPPETDLELCRQWYKEHGRCANLISKNLSDEAWRVMPEVEALLDGPLSVALSSLVETLKGDVQPYRSSSPLPSHNAMPRVADTLPDPFISQDPSERSQLFPPTMAFIEYSVHSSPGASQPSPLLHADRRAPFASLGSAVRSAAPPSRQSNLVPISDRNAQRKKALTESPAMRSVNAVVMSSESLSEIQITQKPTLATLQPRPTYTFEQPDRYPSTEGYPLPWPRYSASPLVPSTRSFDVNVAGQIGHKEGDTGGITQETVTPLSVEERAAMSASL